MSIVTLPRSALAIACALALGAAGSVSAMGNTAMFDPALEDQPCKIVTAELAATALDVPEDSIEQSNVIASQCSYELVDEGDETLSVEITIDAYDTDEGAAEEFRNAARSVSSEEITDTMAVIKEMLDDGDSQNANAQQDAAEGVASGLAQNGIQFEDVNGIADQARFDTSDDTLQLQQGNLRIKLRAFHGPAMPIPDEITQKTMKKLLNTWMQDTMTERKQQAIDLAKVTLAAL